MTKRFCEDYLHLYQNVIFDFDVSIFASDNFDDCIRDIGRNLFSQRPPTFSYVQAFLMFGAYVNHQLKDKSWYKEDMLITAMKNVLDENGFRLPVIIRLSYIFKYILDFLSLSIKK